jgi:hypothetical protein
MARSRIKPGDRNEPPLQFTSDPFVAGDASDPSRPWWVRHRMRALLATMLIPVGVGIVAFLITWLTVQGGLKQHPAYAEALALVQGSTDVTDAIGTDLRPGFKVTGVADDTAGTAEMTFSVTGDRGDAGVRVYALADADETDGWTVTFLDVGLRPDAGAERVVVLRDGFKPEALPSEQPPMDTDGHEEKQNS